jgi:hypothetical protein
MVSERTDEDPGSKPSLSCSREGSLAEEVAYLNPMRDSSSKGAVESRPVTYIHRFETDVRATRGSDQAGFLRRVLAPSGPRWQSGVP